MTWFESGSKLFCHFFARKPRDSIIFSDIMVKLLHFDRVKPMLPDGVALEPAVNQTYYCPALFRARTDAVIAPKETVMVVTESHTPVSKYIGFLDCMIDQPGKKIVFKLTNWHPTQKVTVVKEMLLVEVLKNPLVHDSFCVLRLAEMAEHSNDDLNQPCPPRSEQWPMPYTMPSWRGKRKFEEEEEEDDVNYHLKNCELVE